MKTIDCLRCHKPMMFMKREHVQLGKTGWLIGDWGNLLAGALDVAIFTCPDCGKLEFFRGEFFGEPDWDETGMAKTTCPSCGIRHDLDDPKCPSCGARNPKW